VSSSPDARRQRIHELLLALIARQPSLDLLDADDGGPFAAAQGNPAGWLERNRRLVQHYQALVRSAVTLETLVEQELGDGGMGTQAGPARSQF
jgi:hypothetical protein